MLYSASVLLKTGFYTKMSIYVPSYIGKMNVCVLCSISCGSSFIYLLNVYIILQYYYYTSLHVLYYKTNEIIHIRHFFLANYQFETAQNMVYQKMIRKPSMTPNQTMNRQKSLDSRRPWRWSLLQNPGVSMQHAGMICSLQKALTSSLKIFLEDSLQSSKQRKASFLKFAYIGSYGKF